MKKRLSKAIICVVLIFILIAVSVLSIFMFYPVKAADIESVETKVDQYIKSYEIKAENVSADAILNAFNKAKMMSPESLQGYDSIKIILPSGEYFIDKTLEFSGGKNHNLPIIITSETSQAIINGGFSFSGEWQKYKDGIYVRDLNCDGFRQLYVNKQQAVRSRFPNDDEDYTKECIEGEWLDDSKEYKLGKEFLSVVKDSNIDDLEIHMVEAWTHSIAKIEEVNYENENVIFKFTPQNEKMYFSQRSSKISNPQTWIENSLSLVDTYNEWYYDAENQKLYYYPSSNQDINDLTFYVPQSEQLVSINDTDGIRLDNLTFCYTNWNYPTVNGFVDGQGAEYMVMDKNGEKSWYRPSAAVQICNSDKVEITNCKIENIGGNAVSYDNRCDDVLIYYNDITNIAAGAIIAGSFSEQPMEDPISNNVTIADNVISHIGKSYMGGIGIMVGYAKNLSIDHNEINDGRYTGISVGWGWGAESEMCNYKIRNNKVTDIINNYLYDGAGLYTLGRFSNNDMNVISGNVLEGGHGYAGLYFDEMSNNYIATNNVIGDGNMGFLLMHDINYGLENLTVENNFVSTNKKYVNSYSHPSNEVELEEIPLEKRNVVIKNNFAKINVHYKENANKIINNAGRRN